MRLSRKQSIRLTILILVVFFVLSIISIKLNEKKNNLSPNTSLQDDNLSTLSISKDAEIILNNFERSSMKNGKKEWEVMAKKGKIDPITKKATLKGTELSLFSKDRLIKLKSDYAKINFKGNELSDATLKKNIELNVNNELLLRTETAHYDKEKDTVSTKTPVKIDTNFATITGDSMNIKIQDRVVTISNNVVSVIKDRR